MRVTLFLPFLVLTACVSLSGGQDYAVVCPYDTVWEAASETMQGYSVTSENKNNGTIETAWVEMEGTRRPYGLFAREGFGNRERARLTVAVKKDNDVSSVNILETRQRWHAKGGATQQATRWWPVDPSEEVMEEITAKLTDRLKEKGCGGT
ncbi:MAG: hypothetical protein OEV99_10415 [Nitrospira sp.]|nr:hypothetical protein [Nitrospira sp.]MDH4370247.1 hypothetical protein [Nitrospira sp.]MDH5348331.1 hypothetical protein [Nitrospira sp.]MDH5498027.1 hypothetical protein [Nitrospira sp.]MDH5726653.1 hypothetical protein [Nitrospira sp.]